MRLRFPLFALLFIAGSLAMPHFVHAGIPFFGPIIDKSWTVSSAGVQCALGWGAFMTVINNIIQLLITLAIVFVAPLMIAWAGFLMVVNQGNAGKLTEAKGILIHTVVGIVLALASWMIVDAVMAVLYNPATAGSTWSSLIGSSGLVCLPQQGVGTGLNPTTISPPGLGVVPPGGGGAFTYDPGIQAQVGDESSALSTLLTCMAGKVSPGIGRISSISDSLITSGQKTFAQCAAQHVCAHSANSCHYGGTGATNGKSYAVDFGDDQNMTALTSAATACGANTLNEGTHLHASVGAGTTCSL